MTMEDLPSAFQMFQELGLTKFEISQLCLHCPYLFTNGRSIHAPHKIAFLMDFCDRSFEDVCKVGGLLFRPDSLIYSRFGLLDCLGIDQRQWKLRQILDGGTEYFCKNIALTPAQTFEEFRQAWTPPVEWTEHCKLRARH